MDMLTDHRQGNISDVFNFILWGIAIPFEILIWYEIFFVVMTTEVVVSVPAVLCDVFSCMMCRFSVAKITYALPHCALE